MPKRRRKSTSYAMGRRFEQTIRDAVERMGWRTMRSAGSHDPIDIIVWRPEKLAHQRVIAVQCKRDGEISPAEREGIVSFSAGLATEIYVARSHRRKLQVRNVDHWEAEPWQELPEVF